MTRHQSKGGNPDKSEAAKWTSHGLKGPRGPKLTQNPTHTENVPKDPHASHHAKGGGQPGPQGVAEPWVQFGRTALGPVDPGLPRGASLLAPKGIPGVFAVSLCAAQGVLGL